MGDRTPANHGRTADPRYVTPGRRPVGGVRPMEVGDGSGGDRALSMRAPMRATNVPVQYPMLTETNYNLWAVKMKIIMRTLGVWSAVKGDGEYDELKDEGAFAAISQSVPDSVMMAIAEYETAREAWEAIRQMRVGEDRVKKARVKQLKRQLDRMEMDDGESVTAFAQKLTTLVAEIRSLGEVIKDEAVIETLFGAVPSRFADIVNTIEQWGDLSTMTVAEAVGRLATYEQNGRRREKAGNNEQLMLVTRALEQLMKGKKFSEGAGSSGGGKKGGGRGDDRGDHRAGGSGTGKDKGKKKKHRKFDISKVRCFNCNETGHFASDCPEPSKKQQANLVRKEEDEDTALLMMQVCEVVHTAEVQTESVFLHEEKVLPKLSGDQNKFWYLDTGASNHMTGCEEKFAELDKSVKGSVKFGDGYVVKIEGRGSIMFAAESGEHRVLTEVYHIPRLKSNIISLGQLDENGCKYAAGDGLMTVWDRERKVLAKVKRSRNRLYLLKIEPASPECLQARTAEEPWLWHARYGHIGFHALRMLAGKEMVRGLPQLDHVNRFCDGCTIAKHRRAPFPTTSEFRETDPLQLLHSDLCGPITPATFGGKRYFLLVVDDLTRYMWVVLIKSKDEALVALNKIMNSTEKELNLVVRAIRTDRGGEFTSKEFSNFCDDAGIRHFLTAPYTPQQNGVVERRNQTVVGMARNLLKSKNLPGRFWGEAVATAVFLLNRAPTKSVNEKTPYEALYGVKPDVHYLRVFGCLGFVKKVGVHLPKLADRSSVMVFIGYEPNSKAFRMFDPKTQKLHVSRDVIFEEDKQWDWEASGRENVERMPEIFTVQYPSEQQEETVPSAATTEKTAKNFAAAGSSAATPVSGSATATGAESPENRHFVTPPNNASHPSDEAPRRYRLVQEILDETEEVEAISELCLMGMEEPSSFQEANAEAHWRIAMKEELESIESNGTWELSSLPSGHKPIGLKWVYKIKKDPVGKIIKYKARLVAKGYVQRQGIDFEEVFAPVARMETVKLLLAVAAQMGWQVHHLDVKSAFLNGELQEEVFVTQPPGFVVEGQDSKVLKLHKALYELRQAPRAWNVKLDKTLADLGFEKCPLEHAVYKRNTPGESLLVRVYVDDLIITGTSVSGINQFKDQMKRMFSMSDLGLLNYYLGIQVSQTSDGISICQSSYAEKLLEKSGMKHCNSAQIPLEARLHLSKDSKCPAVDSTQYRSIVGSLRYLIHTRPDITYSVGIVSRFMEKPTSEHLAAVKHILRYVSGTLNLGLVYHREKERNMQLSGFSDSDMAGDVDDRKSTTGVIFYLGSSPVSWLSQKQKVVALSSCEAEYIAATTAACQGIWLGRLLADLTGSEFEQITLNIDNQSAISLCKNPVFHERSKHIETRYHFIREKVEEGVVAVEYIGTNDQLADILTKPLAS
uniref:Uncharacterized protein n=1 Tax=Avena sativa TaxID=4498 RepID=A0ACD5Y6T1_AVESA